ncbi:sideroflexin-1-3 isoform X2 [Coccinella septempunctata]|uniref:sideroflexin-1-3 isoform X2 n=1 Tax=Coccinella septempunctata TaxID=41139 RepID=UPI001D07196A|nr:sideroflexin-1-3 isoform X2 [Coccinella septempunctata]
MTRVTNLFVRTVAHPTIDIDKSEYDLDTFLGRCKHFFVITNPLNLFVSDAELEKAKELVIACRENKPLPDDVAEGELRRAKILYDSAFHPETGQKMNLIGRMSAQVPCNMIITGGMMTFYKSNLEVFLWQWINQSFNALVNFTNRSGDATFTNEQIAQSYVLATSGAVVTAVGLNKALKKAPPVVKRMVPFFAVFAANCINIPLMRAQELKCGTAIYDSDNNKVGYSKAAAQKGISQVIISRVFMAIPGMLLSPIIMDWMEQRGTLCRYPWLALPTQTGLLGLCLIFATPAGCALFNQCQRISFDELDSTAQDDLRRRFQNKPPQEVFFNKGL